MLVPNSPPVLGSCRPLCLTYLFSSPHLLVLFLFPLCKTLEVFFFFFFTYFFFLEANYFTILYWFCHTLTWVHHRCTCVPHPGPPSPLPPHTIPQGHPSAPAQSILYHASNLDWWFISKWYYTCFNAILPNHPTLALSHRVQKTVLYICVSFAVSHTGLSLPSF